MLMQILYEVSGAHEDDLTRAAQVELESLVTEPSRWRLTIEAHSHPAHEDGMMVGKVIARRKRRPAEEDEWGW